MKVVGKYANYTLYSMHASIKTEVGVMIFINIKMLKLKFNKFIPLIIDLCNT